jgi:hypothetical protein
LLDESYIIVLELLDKVLYNCIDIHLLEPIYSSKIVLKVKPKMILGKVDILKQQF